MKRFGTVIALALVILSLCGTAALADFYTISGAPTEGNLRRKPDLEA